MHEPAFDLVVVVVVLARSLSLMSQRVAVARFHILNGAGLIH